MIVLDIEIFHNFFIVGCWSPKSDVFLTFQPPDLPKFKAYLEKYNPLIVTFNGMHFDMRLLRFAFDNEGDPELVKKLKAFSDYIINNIPDDPRKRYYNEFWWQPENHIDVKEVLGGRLVPSLKKLSYRLQMDDLESLPISPDKILTDDEKQKIIDYNLIDLKNTYKVYQHCAPILELRKRLTDEYGVNCLSMSDSKIAEQVIGQNAPRQKPFNAKPMRPMQVFINKKDYHFQTHQLQNWYEDLWRHEVRFKQTFDPVKRKPMFKRAYVSSPNLPPCSPPKVKKGQAVDERQSFVIGDISPPVEIGFGGLHGATPCRGEGAWEMDVASHYPNLIIKHRLLAEPFMTKYKEVLAQRMEYKRAGKKIEADAEKIILNATFGKLAEYYSRLRDPIAATSVSLNGQLSILRLMDMAFQARLDVIQANTDGIITIQNPAEIVKAWEAEMKMPLEVKQIDKFIIKDSNNHCIQYADGSRKIKGATFSFEPNVQHQANYPIINKSIVRFLLDGEPIEKTIREEANIHSFLACYSQGATILRVKLAPTVEDEGVTMPKVVRYYLSTESRDNIFRQNAKTWTRISDTAGCKPLNRVNGFPADVNYQQYIELAEKRLKKI